MKKAKKRLRFICITVIIITILLVASSLGFYSPERPSGEGNNVATTENGWNLILINKDNYIPEDYEVNLYKLANGKKVDERIYPELQRMFDDARSSGLALFVAQGYRTEEEQQLLLDQKQEAYENEGNSPEEARKLAEQWVAIPGTSEHQIGIAVDINADTEKCKPEEVYNWLKENSHKYGFIRRYPENKTDITGISHEPWHYRYVGIDAATEIHEKDICLEEYIQSIN